MTILFEELGPPPGPVPPGELTAPLRLRAKLRETTLAEDGGRLTASLGVFGFRSDGLGLPVTPEPPGFAAMSVRLTLRALVEGIGPPAHLIAGLTLGARLYETANHLSIPLTLSARLTEAPAPPPGSSYATELITDDISFAAITASAATAVVRERMRMHAQNRTKSEATRTITEAVGFDESIQIIFRMLVEEGVAFAGDLAGDYRAMARVRDRLLLEGVVSSAADARAALVASIAMAAFAEMRGKEQLADTIQVNAALASTLTAVMQLVDQVLVEAAQTDTAHMSMLVPDGIQLSASTSSAAEAAALIREGVAFVLHLNLNNAQYIAHVVNSETRQSSTYHNYPFNSFGRLGRTYYGMTPEGIRRLAGPDDDGEAIATRLRAAFTQAGTTRLRRMQSAYLGYRSTGEMWIKLIVANADTGLKEAHCYRLHEQPAENFTVARVPVGQGLRFAYSGWEIESIDGAIIDIDTLEWLPIFIEQRMGGEGGGNR